MRESPVMRQCWAAVARTSRLFRTNSGKAWLSGGGRPVRQADGSVVVPAARPVALGFGLVDGKPVAGQADLNGWTTVEITPEMVGQRVAVWTSIECKRSDGGATSADQLNWIEQVRQAGGIAGVANTPAVAQSIVRDWILSRRARFA